MTTLHRYDVLVSLHRPKWCVIGESNPILIEQIVTNLLAYRNRFIIKVGETFTQQLSTQTYTIERQNHTLYQVTLQ